MKFSFPSSYLLLVLATPSVIAKKGKKTKDTKNKNNLSPIGNILGGPKWNGGEKDLNLDCDPMSPFDDEDRNCGEKDCASKEWKDGCEACMCFNKGNASWCDGAQSVYYDVYFEEHGENPFGDSNYSNRKCNTNFSQQDVSCNWDWECESGLEGCIWEYPNPFGDTKFKCCRRSISQFYDTTGRVTYCPS